MKRRTNHAGAKFTHPVADHLNQRTFGQRHRLLDQGALVIRFHRRSRRVKRSHVALPQPRRDQLIAAACHIPIPHRRRCLGVHARRAAPRRKPAPVLRRQRDRHRVIGKRQHEHAVNHFVWVHTFAVDLKRLWRCGDDRLELVGKRAAGGCIRLFKLVQYHHLCLKVVAPLRVQPVAIDDRAVAVVRASYGPDKRLPHGILAAAFVAAVQYRMVDFAVWVLHLVGHDV